MSNEQHASTADIDSLALDVARRFTEEWDPQRRASLQVAIIQAIRTAQAQHAAPAEQQGIELPTLPEAFEAELTSPGMSPVSVYTAEQMQEYARAALAVTSKQQVGEVQGDALLESLVVRWRAEAAAAATSDNVLCQKIANCTMRHAAELKDALAARQPVGQTFQAGVSEWMGQCFLPSLYSNMTERGDRLLEEVLELLQAHGYGQGRIATLVDYVFGRPVGEPAQEVGGVMVTLAGYCWVADLDMHAAGDAELRRIKQPEVMDKIRRKQEAKNALHFDTPLPGEATANVEDWPREGDLVRYGDGSSALAVRLGPHAGGWHGYQCCGGYTFFTKAYRPSRADMDTWLDCAKYRDERTKIADSRVAHQMYLIDGQRDAAPGVGQ